MLLIWWILIGAAVLLYLYGLWRYYRYIKTAKDKSTTIKENIEKIKNKTVNLSEDIGDIVNNDMLSSFSSNKRIENEIRDISKKLNLYVLFPYFIGTVNSLKAEFKEGLQTLEDLTTQLEISAISLINQKLSTQISKMEEVVNALILEDTDDLESFETATSTVTLDIDRALEDIGRLPHIVRVPLIKRETQEILSTEFANAVDKLNGLKRHSFTLFEESFPKYISVKTASVDNRISEISKSIDKIVKNPEEVNSEHIVGLLSKSPFEETEAFDRPDIRDSPYLRLESNIQVYSELEEKIQILDKWVKELKFARGVVSLIAFLTEKEIYIQEEDKRDFYPVLPIQLKEERSALLHSLGKLEEMRRNVESFGEIMNKKLSKKVKENLDRHTELANEFKAKNDANRESIVVLEFFEPYEKEFDNIIIKKNAKATDFTNTGDYLLSVLKFSSKFKSKTLEKDILERNFKWFNPDLENKLILLAVNNFFPPEVRYNLLLLLGFKSLSEQLYGDIDWLTKAYFNAADHIYSNHNLEVDPIAKYGLFQCLPEESERRIQLLKQIKSHYKKFDPIDKSFAIMSLKQLFDIERGQDLKIALETITIIKIIARDTEHYPIFALKVARFLAKLGRVEEGIEILSKLKVTTISNDMKYLYFKLKSHLYDLSGNYTVSVKEMKNALKFAPKDEKSKILARLVNLKMKYEKWKDIIGFKKSFEEHKTEFKNIEEILSVSIDVATAEIDKHKKKNLQSAIEEVETKLGMINVFLAGEKQTLVPSFAHNIQDILYNIPEAEKFSEYLGLSYYYEAISYELLMDELERIDGCYKLAQLCFHNSGNFKGLAEIQLKMLELNYFQLDNQQNSQLQQTSFQTDMGKFMEQVVAIENFKSERIDALIDQTSGTIDQIEDPEVKAQFRYILDNRESWKEEMKLKFGVFLFASQVDKFELRRKLETMGYSRNPHTQRAIDEIVSLIRRLRPHKNHEFFHFESLISALRRNRISNVLFNNINKNQINQNLFNELSNIFPPLSKLSLIELTSLMFILATPYITHPNESVEDISLNYEKYLAEIMESFTLDLISNMMKQTPSALMSCIIYAAPILFFFQVKEL